MVASDGKSHSDSAALVRGSPFYTRGDMMTLRHRRDPSVTAPVIGPQDYGFAVAAFLGGREGGRRRPINVGYFGSCSKALVPGHREGFCRAIVLRTVPVTELCHEWSTASSGFGMQQRMHLFVMRDYST